ncbi:MAG: flavodoxin domain-containing protein [Longimicrobiaceae bacterium]
MARLLIVYGTTEGHTRKVAERIAAAVRARGHVADVLDASAHPAAAGLDEYDGVVVAASLHYRRHQPSVVRFVRENLYALQRLPTALFSVSLSAARQDPRHCAAARKCVNKFLDLTGWRADRTYLVAGALAYSRYGFLKRRVMRWISWREGGDTDTSRDYEYTDWEKLRGDTRDYLLEVARFAANIDASSPSPA